MRILIAVAVVALSALAPRPVAAQDYGDDRYSDGSATVQCNSYDDGTNRCPINGGRVVLLRQHSRAECIKGRSWGYNAREIWVSRGCRASFRVIGDDYGYGGGYGGGHASGSDLVRCESNDGDYRRCRLPGPGRVRLVRQLSRAACIEGRSWGADRGRLWVSDGCRGDFSVAYGHGSWGDQPREFRCESVREHYVECDADVRRGVELVRQLSRTNCRRGENWGYGRRGVWVDDGCRGLFRSY